MEEASQNQTVPIFKLGDELLLPIFELLSIADVLSCSLVGICTLPIEHIPTFALGQYSLALRS